MRKLLIVLCFAFFISFDHYGVNIWGADCRAQFTNLLDFNNANGSRPRGSLTADGGVLFGMTYGGGSLDSGCVFSIDTNGTHYHHLLDFTGPNGKYPWSAVTISLSGKVLYGVTIYGGANHVGCLFALDTDGTHYHKLHDFSTASGSLPYGSLTLSGNVLYGMTSAGGTNSDGVVFSIDTNGSGYTTLLNFGGANGASPWGGFSLAGNILYGMTSAGGAHNKGCIFSIDTNGNRYHDLYDFNGGATDGEYPYGNVTLYGNKVYGLTWGGGTNGYGIVFSMDTVGGRYMDLWNLANPHLNGANPWGSLAISGKYMYGLDPDGGTNLGCLFTLDTNGSGYTELIDFNFTNGSYPYGSPVIVGNSLYGMTNGEASSDSGNIFAYRDTAIHVHIPAAVSEIAKATGTVTIYPNPNNGNFIVAVTNTNGASLMEVYNILGEKVYKTPLNLSQTHTNVNIGHQPSGVYLYRIVSDDGNIIGEGKLEVQR